MASGQRPVHQDYIARIRYSNALPPPPHPPKLLEIPGTGLAGGPYTSAGYANRLAKDQPLNIEADAELGMPIDLVGLPGVFDGDERAIMAREGAHPIHPADKALLKPLSSLGKGAANSSVSFLRRTEYTASQGTQQLQSGASRDLNRVKNDPKRTKQVGNKEHPINIIRNIVKGFDVAYPEDAYKGEENTTSIRGAAITDMEARAWSKPKHPTKPNLKLLDSYPVLPDLEAIPPSSAYIIFKFAHNPVIADNAYDTRLDAALLRPKDSEEAQLKYQQRLAEWETDPTRPQPILEHDYDYYLPDSTPATLSNLKRKFNPNDPAADDPALYTDELADDSRAFKFSRLRTYETSGQQGDPADLYNSSVALALHDPETDVGAAPGAARRLGKAAYFYPVVQRTALRTKRGAKISALPVEEPAEEINLTVGEPGREARVAGQQRRAELDPNVTFEEEEEEEDAEVTVE